MGRQGCRQGEGGSRTWVLADHNLSISKRLIANRRWARLYKASKAAAPSDLLSLARLHLLKAPQLSQTAGWGPNVQMHESMEDISHSNHSS